MGTPEYASPEQLRGLAIDSRTDVYSFGCVVYQLLTGEPPYVREHQVATIWAHANDPPPSPCAHRPELLPVFDSVIGRATAKEPRDRFPTAGALAEGFTDAVRMQLLSETQKAGRTTLPEQPVDEPVSGFAMSDAPTEAAPSALSPPSPHIKQLPGEAAPAVSDSEALETAPRDGRRRVAFIVLPLLALAAAAAIVLAVTGPGTTPHEAASPPASTSLGADVRRLNGIVGLFIAGKRLSHVEHKYAAAATNRQLVLARLRAFRTPAELRPAAQTLRQMTTDSLVFNNDTARGETAAAHTADNAHNALRRAFVAEFNPYARRYARRTYSVNNF